MSSWFVWLLIVLFCIGGAEVIFCSCLFLSPIEINLFGCSNWCFLPSRISSFLYFLFVIKTYAIYFFRVCMSAWWQSFPGTITLSLTIWENQKLHNYSINIWILSVKTIWFLGELNRFLSTCMHIAGKYCSKLFLLLPCWLCLNRACKECRQRTVNLPCFGEVLLLSAIAFPFCGAFAILWAVFQHASFAWIGQDILVSLPLSLSIFFCYYFIHHLTWVPCA